MQRACTRSGRWVDASRGPGRWGLGRRRGAGRLSSRAGRLERSERRSSFADLRRSLIRKGGRYGPYAAGCFAPYRERPSGDDRIGVARLDHNIATPLVRRCICRAGATRRKGATRRNKDLSARRGRLVLTRRTRSHRWSRTCPTLPTAWRCLRPKPERATLSLMWKTQSRALKISATPSRITRKEPCPTSIRRRVDPTQAPATALICRYVARRAPQARCPTRPGNRGARLPPALRRGVALLSPPLHARRLAAPVELASAPHDRYFPPDESRSLARRSAACARHDDLDARARDPALVAARPRRPRRLRRLHRSLPPPRPRTLARSRRSASAGLAGACTLEVRMRRKHPYGRFLVCAEGQQARIVRVVVRRAGGEDVDGGMCRRDRSRRVCVGTIWC
jgi:hypothetical protein